MFAGSRFVLPLLKEMAAPFPFFRTSNFQPRTSRMVGLGGFEPPTSRLSGVRSNQLSYRPLFDVRLFEVRGSIVCRKWLRHFLLLNPNPLPQTELFPCCEGTPSHCSGFGSNFEPLTSNFEIGPSKLNSDRRGQYRPGSSNPVC